MNSLSQLHTTKCKSFMTVNQNSQTVIHIYYLPFLFIYQIRISTHLVYIIRVMTIYADVS